MKETVVFMDAEIATISANHITQNWAMPRSVMQQTGWLKTIAQSDAAAVTDGRVV